jgi:hypothetical protein
MAAVLPVVRARSSIDALNYAIEELGHSQAELAEPYCNIACNIYTP